MKTKSLKIHLTIFFIALAFCGMAQPKVALSAGSHNDLVGKLTSRLGVTKEQATGGAGSIFKLAKEKLSSSDFSKVSEGIPGVDSLMSAAPKTGGLENRLGGAPSLFGKKAKSVGGLTSLTGNFSKLGLSPDMIGKFVPVVLEHAQNMSGDKVMNLLKGALK